MVKRFMAPGPWITRDLKECVLASDYDALAAENAALKAQLAYAASTGDECAIEVESLRSRLAECEKDAARYREVWNSWPLTFGEMLQSGYGVYPIENKAQGDAAIDAYLSRNG